MLRRFIQSESLLADAGSTLVVRMAGIGLMFAMTTLTARFLGADEYGTFSAAWALAILLATLAPVGSDRILVRNLSTVESPHHAGADTAIAHMCTLIVTVLIIFTVVTFTWPGSPWSIVSEWRNTVVLAVVMCAPIALTYLRQWVAIPLIGTRSAVMPEQTVLPLVFMAALIGLRYSPIQLTAKVVTITFSAAMLTVWGGSLLNARIRTAYSQAWRSIPRAQEIRQRMSDGLPFVSVSIGGVVLQKCLPVVIAATCGFHATAQFALGMQYAALPAIPLGVINLCMIPRCARHFHNHERSEANHVTRIAATLTFLLAIGLSLLTWLLGPMIVAVLGKSYDGITVILPTLLLASIVDSFAGPAVPVMQTMKLESAYSRALYAFLPFQVAVIWVTSRLAGLEGAAMGYLLSRIVWNVIVILIIWRARRLLSVPYFQMAAIFSPPDPVILPLPSDTADSNRAIAC